jgi:hypothetical protein
VDDQVIDIFEGLRNLLFDLGGSFPGQWIHASFEI